METGIINVLSKNKVQGGPKLQKTREGQRCLGDIKEKNENFTADGLLKSRVHKIFHHNLLRVKK